MKYTVDTIIKTYLNLPCWNAEQIEGLKYSFASFPKEWVDDGKMAIIIFSKSRHIIRLAKHHGITSGWWYTYPSEKYEFVSWNDEIPDIWKKKNHVPVITNQTWLTFGMRNIVIYIYIYHETWEYWMILGIINSIVHKQHGFIFALV